jgi:hypothetical protein
MAVIEHFGGQFQKPELINEIIGGVYPYPLEGQTNQAFSTLLSVL